MSHLQKDLLGVFALPYLILNENLHFAKCSFIKKKTARYESGVEEKTRTSMMSFQIVEKLGKESGFSSESPELIKAEGETLEYAAETR